MGRAWFLCFVAACSFDSSSAPGPPEAVDAGGAEKRVRLTFRNLGGPELVDFPVLVVLDAGRIDYGATAPGGADVHFRDRDEEPLAHEVELWDPDGSSYLWVGVPSIAADSDDDFMWMIYGDAASATAPDPAAVWTGDYVAVWHLAEEPAPGAEILDSTAAGLHGTASEAMSSADRGVTRVGMGLRFSGDADSRVMVAAPGSFTLPTYSWSMWLKADAPPQTGAGIRQPLWNANQQFNFAWDHANASFVQAATHSDGSFRPAQIDQPLAGDVWYQIAATYDGESLVVYLDGEPRGAATAGTPLEDDRPLMIGGGGSGDSPGFVGWIDEVRVARSARSGGWIRAQYRSQSGHFVEFGD